MKSNHSLKWIAVAISGVVLLLTLAFQALAAGPDSSDSAPALTAATQGSSESQPVSVSGADTTPHVQWVTVNTLEELTANADLVVRGRVTKQRPAVLRSYPWNEAAQRPMTSQEAGNVYSEAPLTVSTFLVSEVVLSKDGATAAAGGPVAAGKTIEVVELGGRRPDGRTSIPHDKPLLGKSEEAILFLSKAERRGAYHVVGGWQGRMMIRDGLIYPLASDVHRETSGLVRHHGRNAADFARDVREIQR